MLDAVLYNVSPPAESHASARSEPMTIGTGAERSGAATLGTEDFSTGGFTVTHLNRSNIGPPLIALGGALLATRVLEFGTLEFPFLSAVLVVIGALRRESAWFIPGGILAGLGLGDYLTEASPLAKSLTEEAATGVFLLSFALGWVGVFALSRRLGDAPNTWGSSPPSS